jgi:nucleoside-diphosphate-sugar epimerase
MKILILGGTGFIGYHTARECLLRGHEVTALALPPLPKKGLLPDEVNIKLANIDELDDARLRKLLSGHDAVIDAAGADDRVIPKAPAYDFFYRANVLPAERLFKLSKQVGVKRGVLLSSYFAYFDRIWPELKLSTHHPYIRSRREQSARALAAAAPELDLMVLELPFVFGSMPGRDPLWKPLVNYLRSPFPFYCPRGGTNMIAIQHVAEAIVGALEKGIGGQTYVVGDENHNWRDLICMFGQQLGIDKPVHPIPNFMMQTFMESVGFWHHLQGKESGLHPGEFVKVFTSETFFDPSAAREALGYGSGGLITSIQETIAACPKKILGLIPA